LESVLAYYCLAVSIVVWEGGASREARCYNIASNMVEKSEIEPGMELKAGLRTCQKRQASGSVEWEGVPGDDEVELPTATCGDGP
jgi:hypothetical protein